MRNTVINLFVRPPAWALRLRGMQLDEKVKKKLREAPTSLPPFQKVNSFIKDVRRLFLNTGAHKSRRLVRIRRRTRCTNAGGAAVHIQQPVGTLQAHTAFLVRATFAPMKACCIGDVISKTSSPAVNRINNAGIVCGSRNCTGWASSAHTRVRVRGEDPFKGSRSRGWRLEFASLV